MERKREDEEVNEKATVVYTTGGVFEKLKEMTHQSL